MTRQIDNDPKNGPRPNISILSQNFYSFCSGWPKQPTKHWCSFQGDLSSKSVKSCPGLPDQGEKLVVETLATLRYVCASRKNQEFLNHLTTWARICAGNLDLLSHFCQGRVAKTVTQRSKWLPANLDNYAAGIDKNQPRGSWKLCGNSQICCKLTTKVFHNHHAMIQPFLSFSGILKNFMTSWCKIILVHK